MENTFTVVVHKASLVLLPDETLQSYMTKLSGAVMAYGTKKFGAKPYDVSLRETFPDSVVFCVYPGPNSPPDTRAKLYQSAYKRAANGEFGIETPVEVEAVTTYAPVPAKPMGVTVSVAKQEGNAAPADSEVSKAVTDTALNPTAKAVWSAAYVNNLPDSAFALILPGGKKDAEGKTKPRSLRMLPHHTPDVKSGTEHDTVDLPHLRNALARLDQMATSPATKAKARAHLEAHAKELLGK